MSRRKRRKNTDPAQVTNWISEYLNLYNLWYDRFLNVAISCIRWKGKDVKMLPSVNMLEKTLIERGSFAIFKDEILGFMFLPVRAESPLNEYGYSQFYTAYGVNGYTSKSLEVNRDCAIVRSNPIGSPDLPNIEMYAEMMSQLIISWNCNIIATRTQTMVTAPYDAKLTALNIMQKRADGTPFVFADEIGDAIRYSAFKLDVPFLAGGLTEQMQAIWADFLTWLGVPSMSVQKKANLLKEEATQQTGGSLASRSPRMSVRESAVEVAKDIFPDIDISVEFDIDNMMESVETAKKEEEIGNIHDGTL